MTQHTVHARVEGRVQGVWFRDYTQRKALEIGVTGWVRNRADGSVEAMITGTREGVQQMTDWLAEGSPMSMVRRVTVQKSAHTETFDDFSVRY